MIKIEPTVLYHLETITSQGVHTNFDNVRVQTVHGQKEMEAIAYEVAKPGSDSPYLDKKVGHLIDVKITLDNLAGVAVSGYATAEAAAHYCPRVWHLKPVGFTRPPPPPEPPPQSNDSKVCKALDVLFGHYLKMENVGPVDAREWMQKHHVPWTADNVKLFMKSNKHWVVNCWESALPSKYQSLSSEIHYLLWGEATMRNLKLIDEWSLTNDPLVVHDQAVS
jgi:hypothetical protein